MKRDTRTGNAILHVESRPIEGCEPWPKLTVPCPRRGPIGLEVCMDCARLTRVAIDPDTNEMLLYCEPDVRTG